MNLNMRMPNLKTVNYKKKIRMYNFKTNRRKPT